MDSRINSILYFICNTAGEESGRAGGAAALPRSPEGELPLRFVHASGRDRKEKGATGEPATPS